MFQSKHKSKNKKNKTKKKKNMCPLYWKINSNYYPWENSQGQKIPLLFIPKLTWLKTTQYNIINCTPHGQPLVDIVKMLPPTVQPVRPAVGCSLIVIVMWPCFDIRTCGLPDSVQTPKHLCVFFSKNFLPLLSFPSIL